MVRGGVASAEEVKRSRKTVDSIRRGQQSWERMHVPIRVIHTWGKAAATLFLSLSGFRVQGSGLRVQGLGFISGSRCEHLNGANLKTTFSSVSTRGPLWGHHSVVLGAIMSLLEPFWGYLSPKIDKVC